MHHFCWDPVLGVAADADLAPLGSTKQRLILNEIPHMAEVVKRRFALDLKLYDFAVELFERRYARMEELRAGR